MGSGYDAILEDMYDELGEKQESWKKETVDHPVHYGSGTYEAINVIEAWDLGFNLGNVVKYIARAGRKGDRHQDLLKALWYLERELGHA